MKKKILTAILVISAGCVLFGVSQNVYACGTPPPPPLPNAVVTAPSYVRMNDSTVFDASGSTAGGGEITSYEWDWTNDDTYDDTTTTATMTHTYDDAGNGTKSYAIKVKVTNSYGGWDTATCTFTVFSTIQAAITDASDDAVIELPDGTYSGTGNKDLTWSGKNLTIQSANGPSKCIIDCEGSKDSLARGFYLTNLGGNQNHIRGITIQNGYVKAEGGYNGCGGGIYCSNSSVHIDNCVIRNNCAGVNGSGIAIVGEATPTITNCMFFANVDAESIYCNTNGSAKADITDCTITENLGGGIYCGGVAPTINRCSITKNRDSGIHFYNCSGNGEVKQCVIAGNKVVNGGAIYCERGNSNLVIDSCRIINNGALYEESKGAGIYCSGASPTIQNCVIADNSYVYDGGGVVYGGGIHCQYLNGYSCTPKIKNCTFNNNRNSDVEGSAIYCEGASVEVVNCTFWRTLSYSGADIGLYSRGSVPSILNISYSNTEQASPYYIQPGYPLNIVYQSYMHNSDPCFKNADAGDYRPQTVISGTSTGVPNLDIIGATRTNHHIGAYEGTPAAQTISVPTHYAAIQRAIDWANNEDTVQVANGVYKFPNVGLTWAYNSKAVTVKSQNGASNCTIDVEGMAHSAGYGEAFRLHEPIPSGFVVDGFTIQNAHSNGIDIKSSSPTIKNCVIKNCGLEQASSSHRGIYGQYSSATISNCTVTGCTQGGGIWFTSSGSPVIENCTITRNSGTNQGGGIRIEGADATIRNCLVAGNRADFVVEDAKSGLGGGIYIRDSTSTIIGCTIVGNHTGRLNGGAGGIKFDNLHGGHGDVINCIVWANGPENILGSDYRQVAGADNIVHTCIQYGFDAGEDNIGDDPLIANLCKFTDISQVVDTTTTIKVNDANKYAVGDYIEYNNDGIGRCVTNVNTTTKKITFDLALCDPIVCPALVYNWGWRHYNVTEDYHLSSNSPCIDKGDPSGTYTDQTDLDGGNRVVNWPGIGYDTGNDIDMGADEYHGN